MDPIGVGAVVVVLVVGTAAGLWRARTNGRLHDVRPLKRAPGADPAGAQQANAQPVGAGFMETRPEPASAEPASAEPAGMRLIGVEQAEVEAAGGGATGERLDPALLAGLGVEPGVRGTILQFSSAFCAPCRAVRRVSAEVADLIDGVSHVEVDAESHLDAVRALGIWRTPTVLILDGDGRVTKRATGVPTKPHLIAALAG